MSALDLIALILAIGFGHVVGFFLIVALWNLFGSSISIGDADEPPFCPDCDSMLCEKEIEELANPYEFEFGITKVGNVSVNKKKPWSKKFAFCLQCETTDRPCHGRGMCKRCYDRWYRA